MILSAIVAYGHYLGFLVAVAALVVEALTLDTPLEQVKAWRIVIADAIYGLAALLVLGTGILRVLYFGQGVEFYTHNPIFWVKIGLFILIGTLSLYPTILFLTWIPKLRSGEVPEPAPGRLLQLKWIIRIEIVGFACIPLFAALMARGIGLS